MLAQINNNIVLTNKWKEYLFRQSQRITRKHNSISLENSKFICELLRCSKDKRTLDYSELSKFLKLNFIAIPEKIYESVYLWLLRDNDKKCYIDHIRNKLLPKGFNRQTSVLDYPSLYSNIGNSNQTLSKDELSYKIKRFISNRFENIEEFIRDIDENNDKLISKLEFSNWCRHNNIGLKMPIKKLNKYINNIFKDIDLNSDNYLSYNEIKKYLDGVFKKIKTPVIKRRKREKNRRACFKNRFSLYNLLSQTSLHQHSWK